MMYLLLVSLASLGMAFSPFAMVQMMCPILLPHCLEKVGASDKNLSLEVYISKDLGGDERDNKVKKVAKCIRKGKPGHKIRDEEPLADIMGLTCVDAIETLMVELKDSTPRNLKCEMCADLRAECKPDEVMTSDLYDIFNQCVWDGSPDHEGCCECLYSCPEFSRDDAKQACRSATLDDCRTTLDPHYGACSKSSGKCKLKYFWKDTCESLKRRKCTMAKDVGACTNKKGREKGTRFLCEERTREDN